LCFSLRFVSRPRRWSLRLRTDRTEKIYKLKKKNHQLLLLLLLVNLYIKKRRWSPPHTATLLR
jgi:hypothetical protein